MTERSIDDLIAVSSLGTPDAVRMRERTSTEQARRVVARAKEIGDLNVRLLVIAADPAWSPVLRAEAALAADDYDLDPDDDSDEAIADALRARIVRRGDAAGWPGAAGRGLGP